jgi:hypothetical protein
LGKARRGGPLRLKPELRSIRRIATFDPRQVPVLLDGFGRIRLGKTRREAGVPARAGLGFLLGRER